MKVKIKTKDEYFDFVKLECSAVELLVIRSALKNMEQDRTNDFTDRALADSMLTSINDEMERRREDAKRDDIPAECS